MTDHNFIFEPTAGAPLKMWAKGVTIEEAAMRQLVNVASLPFIHKHVAVMPDCHWGMGATVGSVIATKKAIIPASVGVDIGCGMNATMTSLTARDLPDNLSAIRSAIEAAVPHGRTNNGQEGDRGAWHNVPELMQRTVSDTNEFGQRLVAITSGDAKLTRSARRAANHLGTLGTGNHFIELCLDEQDRVWVMLHSGSRGIGNAIGRHFIELAKADMRKWFINLPDADLAYFPEGTEHFNSYLNAVEWAQEYAHFNRRIMMGNTIQALAEALGRGFDGTAMVVSCHHNYVSRESHFGENVLLTRKGAVRAREGDWGIIPGSMGVQSYIVRGKGNADSFHSCSHGAGRVMSRTEARKRFTLEDHAAATAHVECRKDADVIDETPAAYKDIDAVMAAQSDLVEIMHTLRQVVCVKG